MNRRFILVSCRSPCGNLLYFRQRHRPTNLAALTTTPTPEIRQSLAPSGNFGLRYPAARSMGRTIPCRAKLKVVAVELGKARAMRLGHPVRAGRIPQVPRKFMRHQSRRSTYERQCDHPARGIPSRGRARCADRTRIPGRGGFSGPTLAGVDGPRRVGVTQAH